MINEDQNTNPVEDNNESLIDKNSAKNDTQNWDEKEMLNRNPQGTLPQNERSNLQADDEKRQGMPGGQMDPGKRENRQDSN